MSFPTTHELDNIKAPRPKDNRAKVQNAIITIKETLYDEVIEQGAEILRAEPKNKAWTLTRDVDVDQYGPCSWYLSDDFVEYVNMAIGRTGIACSGVSMHNLVGHAGNWRITANFQREDVGAFPMTLGALIETLERVPAHLEIRIDVNDWGENHYPWDEYSYRGYYEDLCFEPCLPEKPILVDGFLKKCKHAVGGAYEGYKGGEYTMGNNTRVWIADYGETGRMIVGVQEREIDGQCVIELITREGD